MILSTFTEKYYNVFKHYFKTYAEFKQSKTQNKAFNTTEM
jgi:hypothetical protein